MQKMNFKSAIDMILLSVCLSKALCTAVLRVSVGRWKMYRHVSRRGLPVHCQLYRSATNNTKADRHQKPTGINSRQASTADFWHQKQTFQFESV